MNQLDTLITQNSGKEFQRELASFIILNRLKNCVETGAGVSSVYIVKAMQENEFGFLTSIDPSPWAGFEVIHDKYKLIKKRSVDALLPLYLESKSGRDFFLHDGNHDILCQTLEYDFAFACLNPGGWLASDDYTWGGHGAWQNFLTTHNLTPTKIGSIEMVQKKTMEITKEEAPIVFKNYLAKAKEVEKRWLKAGNINTGIFQ